MVPRPPCTVGLVLRNSNGEHLYDLNTGPDGAYQTALLANDTYFLHTRDEPFGLGRELCNDIPCQFFNNCGDPATIVATATPVIIEGADETGIDFSLQVPAGGMISGQLTDADTGIPLTNVRVVLLDEFHSQVMGRYTGPLGNHYFSALDDGNYKVYAVNVPKGYTMELYGGDHCPDWSCDLDLSGTPITISGGSVAAGKAIGKTGQDVFDVVARGFFVCPLFRIPVDGPE